MELVIFIWCPLVALDLILVGVILWRINRAVEKLSREIEGRGSQE